VVILTLLAAPALAGGFTMDAEYTSAYGPDAYGALRLVALTEPDLALGVLGLGGVQPAWFGTAARSVALGAAVTARAELALGMARAVGPAGGGRLGLTIGAEPLSVVADVGWLSGLGFRGEAGVDAPLAGRWTVSPRLRLETWAGGRDPALRAELGLSWRADGGFFVGAAGSAGGRDVLHTGGGASLTLGRIR